MATALFRCLFVGALVALSWQALTPVPYESLTTVNDKLGHAAAFFVLMLLAERGWPHLHSIYHKGLPLLVYGGVIELLQLFVPYRLFSLLDWIADGAGLLLYLFGRPLVHIFTQPTAAREN